MAKSNTLVEDARKCLRAVVQIYAEGLHEEDTRQVLDPRNLSKSRWTGSGFFISIEGKAGYILTNAHVVRNATFLRVMTVESSEEMFKVQVVGSVRSLEPDIALLKLYPSELRRLQDMIGNIPALKLASFEDITRGTEIKAIGYPLGMAEPNISGGEISNFISGGEDSTERLVTDAAINPGNSGGPSVMAGGKVVGINTSIVIDANNIGFITPIFYAKILLENLAKGGHGTLAQVGGTLQKNSLHNAGYLGMDQAKGVIVSSLLQGGFLEQIGLKPHDVIVKLNDIEFDRHGIVLEKKRASYRHKNIFDVMRLFPIGQEVELTYIRDGEQQVCKGVTCTNPSTAIRHHFDVFSRPYIVFEGMIIQELSYQIIEALVEHYPISYQELEKLLDAKGPSLIVTHIDAESQGDDLYVEVGDCVKSINQKETGGLYDFLKIANACQQQGDNVFIEFVSGAIGCFMPRNTVELVQISSPLMEGKV